MPLKILHFSLVLLGGRASFERTEIAAAACAGILLSRVKPVLAGCEFANHRKLLMLLASIAIHAPNLPPLIAQ